MRPNPPPGRVPLFPFVAATVSLAFLCLLIPAAHAQDPLPPVPTPQSDAAPLLDPTRPVTRITRDSVTLQWYTATPCETRLQVRQSELPMTAWRPEGKKLDPWAESAPGVRVVNGPPGKRTYHVLTVNGLKPGARHFYRLFDPGAKPTAQEKTWGARAPWRREYAVSTQAPAGRKTVVRIPVKVLLMTNVVNVTSGKGSDGAYPAPPAAMTPAELRRVRDEYETAARFFFVNSGMRYWVDFQFFVDDRWQRWGDEPADAAGFYKGLPVSRSYPGVEFKPPGGGTWTIVDTTDLKRHNDAPVFEERPYAGQVEQAFVRKWNPERERWERINSGGGTFGVDGFPRGVPGRSQYLGGTDISWLAVHEFHHQMESEGRFSFAGREDERIVYNHPAARAPDSPWNTAGRHGAHYDVMAW